TLREQGVDAADIPVIAADYSEDGGYRAAKDLFAAKKKPDAIFVANNLMGVGLVRALAELKIPADEILVAAFDKLPWSAAMKYPVQTLSVPTYEMGQTAAKLLLERINGSAAPTQERVLSVEEL